MVKPFKVEGVTVKEEVGSGDLDAHQLFKAGLDQSGYTVRVEKQKYLQIF